MLKYLEDGTIIQGTPEDIERFEQCKEKRRLREKLRWTIY